MPQDEKSLTDKDGNCRCCKAKRAQFDDPDAPRAKDMCVSVAAGGVLKPGCLAKSDGPTSRAHADGKKKEAPPRMGLLPASASQVTDPCMAAFLTRGPTTGESGASSSTDLPDAAAAAAQQATPAQPVRASAREGGVFGNSAVTARTERQGQESAERLATKTGMRDELVALRKQVLALQAASDEAEEQQQIAEKTRMEGVALTARATAALGAWTELTVEKALEHNKSLRIGPPLADAAVRAVIAHTRSVAVAEMAGEVVPPSHNLTRITFGHPSPPPPGVAPLRAPYFIAGMSVLLVDWRQLGHCHFSCSKCASETVEVPHHEKDADGATREQ